MIFLQSHFHIVHENLLLMGSQISMQKAVTNFSYTFIEQSCAKRSQGRKSHREARMYNMSHGGTLNMELLVRHKILWLPIQIIVTCSGKFPDYSGFCSSTQLSQTMPISKICSQTNILMCQLFIDNFFSGEPRK